MTSSISVVIVTYNSKAQIIPCLDSVLKNQGDFKLSIVIVDNNSFDETLATLRARHSSLPNLAILENTENKGFAAGETKVLIMPKIILILVFIFFSTPTRP